MHWLINECVACLLVVVVYLSLYSFTSCENFKNFNNFCIVKNSTLNHRKEIPSTILSPYARILWNLKVKKWQCTNQPRVKDWWFENIFGCFEVWGATTRLMHLALSHILSHEFIITSIVRAHTAILALLGLFYIWNAF